MQKDANCANIEALEIYTEYYKSHFSDDLSLELISVKVKELKVSFSPPCCIVSAAANRHGSLLEDRVAKSNSDMYQCSLTHFEHIVGLMHGMRITSCKSAKDRTSMAVTLENVIFLKERYRNLLRSLCSVSVIS